MKAGSNGEIRLRLDAPNGHRYREGDGLRIRSGGWNSKAVRFVTDYADVSNGGN